MGFYDAISSTENLAKAVKRLPNYLRQTFYESTRDYDSENVVTLIEFEKWLQIRISHLFNPIANIIASQETKSKDVPPHARSNHGKIMQSEDNKLTCWLCNDKHKLHQCEMFKSKSLPEKKVIVEKERLCWNCLAKGHQIKECKSTVKCRITNCGKRHHTLLHEIKPPNPPKDDVTTNNLKANIDPKVYLQILPVKVSNGKRTVKTNALLDAGADSMLIREDIAKQLDLHGNSRNLKIHNAFLKSKTVESKLVNFSVSSKDHPEKIDIKNAWTVLNLNIRHHSYNVESLKET